MTADNFLNIAKDGLILTALLAVMCCGTLLIAKFVVSEKFNSKHLKQKIRKFL